MVLGRTACAVGIFITSFFAVVWLLGYYSGRGNVVAISDMQSAVSYDLDDSGVHWGPSQLLIPYEVFDSNVATACDCLASELYKDLSRLMALEGADALFQYIWDDAYEKQLLSRLQSGALEGYPNIDVMANGSKLVLIMCEVDYRVHGSRRIKSGSWDLRGAFAVLPGYGELLMEARSDVLRLIGRVQNKDYYKRMHRVSVYFSAVKSYILAQNKDDARGVVSSLHLLMNKLARGQHGGLRAILELDDQQFQLKELTEQQRCLYALLRASFRNESNVILNSEVTSSDYQGYFWGEKISKEELFWLKELTGE